jgi:hypothetical protein
MATHHGSLMVNLAIKKTLVIRPDKEDEIVEMFTNA